jgi:hypothetical protein
MRSIILLTFVAMLTGCQHGQKCQQVCRSACPLPTCKVRDAGNCRDQQVQVPRCDLKTACRGVQSSCQKVCNTPPSLGCKRLTVGWKEIRVPVAKFRDQRHACDAGRSCNSKTRCGQREACGPKTCCKTPAVGCCRDFPNRPTEATPFLTLPPPPPVTSTRPQNSQWRTIPSQPVQTRQPASQSPADLAQRTRALETQVHEIHSMLQQRQAVSVPQSGYQSPSFVPVRQQDVIMLPPPAWRTMDGVPPIPDSAIEQTGASGSGYGYYRTVGTPQMWAHSPQNMQRSMLR